ncbi:probable cytosolic oligopeptidase A [Rhagoletis pomonella]|uniref:probable cytosolic oligopeptidase A n=1 Tax=Rhagoletis pomonella TaxID=28610 RepID=UPI00177B86CD|nr:probable cytosolic oligopeptidase A [Rhagoletis pomonella]
MYAVLRRSRLIATAKPNQYIAHRNAGYIVLVPEIGEDTHLSDGILQPDGLPAFNDITIENCLGAIGQQAGLVEKTVKTIENEIIDQNTPARSLKSIFEELDKVAGPLDTTWGIAKALYLGNSTLIPTKSYMNIHERARIARASKYNSKVLHDGLVQRAEQAEGDEARLLQRFLLEGKLNGLTQTQDKRESLKDILVRLGRERASFKNKVNMSVHTFGHAIKDFNLVRDFPLTLLEAIAKDSTLPTQGPWKITLQPQIVEGFLKYCPDRTQRWNVWQANVRKASGQQERSLENSTHLEIIRSFRKRQANLLGYPNYAAMSMQTKMVKSVDNLKQIFANLLKFAGPAQSTEIEQLQNFAVDSGFQHKLDLYDVAYWQRKHLLANHQLNEDKLREYFPLPHVFAGLIKLSENMLNIRIVERQNVEVWQPAVKYYDVFDNDAGGDVAPVGGFYIDCYSKENKFGKNNGWMVSIRNRNPSAQLTPLCALIFNFTEPSQGKPYLLSFDDLNMVFKTFGSALQHLLTKAPYTDLAGLSNIEWDASQVAGNVMSNFLDNTAILKQLSKHYSSDEVLSGDTLGKIKLLKTSLAGYNLCRELYLADLDIELHQSDAFWLDVVKKLWPVYHCMPLDKKDAHPCSMTEIFSGDWAAAQFSHLYSKVIAADISAQFAEKGETELSTTGKRFKETFLALGGSVPTAEVFRRFRGRDPSVEALLKSLNIFNKTQTTGEL